MTFIIYLIFFLIYIFYYLIYELSKICFWLRHCHGLIFVKRKKCKTRTNIQPQRCKSATTNPKVILRAPKLEVRWWSSHAPQKKNIIICYSNNPVSPCSFRMDPSRHCSAGPMPRGGPLLVNFFFFFFKKNIKKNNKK